MPTDKKPFINTFYSSQVEEHKFTNVTGLGFRRITTF